MGNKIEKTNSDEELVGPVLSWLEDPHSRADDCGDDGGVDAHDSRQPGQQGKRDALRQGDHTHRQPSHQVRTQVRPAVRPNQARRRQKIAGNRADSGQRWPIT